MTRNLMFNTCRESGDHGAFNSWDRLPYVTDVRKAGTPSTIPAFNEASFNFIVANYAADGGCLDNDDGSSYYDIHHNFCVFGGHKSDFDGNAKLAHHNLYVQPKVYGPSCINELQALPPEGYAEGFYNNTCVLASANESYIQVADSACPGSIAAGLLLGNNTVYVPGGQARVNCGHGTYSEYDAGAFIGEGLDNGTVVSGDMPSSATLIEWARTLLSM